MPLNDLLYRHQVALMRAAASASTNVRVAHEASAAACADRVAALVVPAGATTAPLVRGASGSNH